MRPILALACISILLTAVPLEAQSAAEQAKILRGFRKGFKPTKNRRRSLSLSADAARKALAIDDTRPGAYLSLANIAIVKRQYDQAISHCEKALSLDPTASVMAHCGRIWTYVGKPQEALELIRQAMRRNPYFPPIYLFVLGNAHRLMGNYDDAIAAIKAWRKADPTSRPALINLTVVHAQAGRMEEARATAKKLLKRFPTFSLKAPKKILRYKHPADRQRYISSLRKAGVPE